MGTPDVDRLINDALLLDAVEGLEGVASCLMLVYDELCGQPGPLASTAIVLQLLEELGWWSGRLEAAVSSSTQDSLGRIASSDEA